MQLIAELRRRSVFKVGVAYLVVGWLVIQIAATVFPSFGIPAWALRLVTLVVLLGFPLALVLAWVFDLTPEGVKLEAGGVGSKRLFVTAGLIAAIAIGWFVRGFDVGASGPEVYDAPLGAESTAVLPFVNMSADKDNEYFSDGLTETLLHKLAQVPDLKVAARTSSFAFKGKQEDIRDIGRELGVATVMEGSVQRAGDTLRITAQLVRTADGSHIWSRNYDRKMADLFAIQDEIAGAVTEALVGALVPATKAAIAKGGTQDLEAYDLYTKALSLSATASFDSLKQAEALLQQAIVRDPKYVDAMTELVWTWDTMSTTGIITADERAARVDAMLDRIEAIDPTDPRLIMERASGAMRRGEKDAAIALFERALAIAPSDPKLLALYSFHTNAFPDTPEGKARNLDLISRAVALDPLNPQLLYNQAKALGRLDRLDEAAKVGERIVKVAPDSPLGYQLLGDIARDQGRLADEFVQWRRSQRVDPTDHELTAELALDLDALGDRADADLWLAKALAMAPDSFYTQAMDAHLAFRRGDMAKAYARTLPLVPRHAESRRNNWSRAMSEGCYAALALGKRDEFIKAMTDSRWLPDGLSRAAFEAVITPQFNASHAMAHVSDLRPCLFPPGPDQAKRYAAIDATGTALIGAGWTEGRDNSWLHALAIGDKASFAKLLADGVDSGALDLVHAEMIIALEGVADDPTIVKALADRRAIYARESARLPAALAAAKVSAAP